MRGSLTSHRKTVLEVVKESHDHPTAREIFSRASGKAASLSFATVYNSLKYLTDNGYLHEVEFGDGSSRYDATLEPHHHLICRQCGLIEDFEKLALLNKSFRAPRGFQVDEVQVQLKGTCEACQRKQR